MFEHRCVESKRGDLVHQSDLSKHGSPNAHQWACDGRLSDTPELDIVFQHNKNLSH